MVFTGQFSAILRQNARAYVSIPCAFSLSYEKLALWKLCAPAQRKFFVFSVRKGAARLTTCKTGNPKGRKFNKRRAYGVPLSNAYIPGRVTDEAAVQDRILHKGITPHPSLRDSFFSGKKQVCGKRTRSRNRMKFFDSICNGSGYLLLIFICL